MPLRLFSEHPDNTTARFGSFRLRFNGTGTDTSPRRYLAVRQSEDAIISFTDLRRLYGRRFCRPGAKIEQIIRRAYYGFVVFYDQERIAQIPQAPQRIDHLAVSR
jgi:hypothetical protein